MRYWEVRLVNCEGEAERVLQLPEVKLSPTEKWVAKKLEKALDEEKWWFELVDLGNFIFNEEMHIWTPLRLSWDGEYFDSPYASIPPEGAQDWTLYADEEIVASGTLPPNWWEMTTAEKEAAVEALE